jgi:exonuclease-1
MDRNGEGFEIKLENLKNSTEMDFSTFSGDMFLKMCILSGCDYLPSIKSIGLKKSHKLFVEFGDNLPEIINRIKEKLPIDDDYLDNFEKALLTFKF